MAVFRAAGEPVISVDTKKKELVGDFRNGGREFRRKGQPEPVRVHDFVIPERGKVAPYGVYDISANDGWVNPGISHDSTAFAVESIRRWRYALGAARDATARRLLINADGGGGNGNRAYEKGIKVSDTEMASLTVKPEFLPRQVELHIAPRQPDGGCGYQGSGPEITE